jgi:large subunit ribosomal protein L9
MQIILLERVGKLGQMGDEVTVRDGFARNYLLPQGKALRATKTNRERFERDRVQLEARNLELKSEAQKVAERLEGQSFIVIREAGDTGQLYGSVSPRDIAGAVTEGGFSIERHQVMLPRPIKTLGLHEVHLSLHPEVKPKVNVNVARSPEEAARQARGEDVTAQAMEDAEEAEAAEAAKRTAEELFEEGAAEDLDAEEGLREDEETAEVEAAEDETKATTDSE